MKAIDLLILSWHQTYLKNYAGGYIRIREFLKRVPKNIDYFILDNKPSIYKDIFINKSKLIEYAVPNFLKYLLKKTFILWYLLETLFAGIIIYAKAKKLIETKGIKVLYVPIGEFCHLYLPAIILKKKFPHIRLIVDILNYEIPDQNAFVYYKRLRKNGQGILRALAIVLNGTVNSYIRRKSITAADYIFTVSPDLVVKIKKDYKKNTIDFTPSGVNLPSSHIYHAKRKYLGVYVGRMNVEKGVVEIIHTWAEVVKKLPDAKVALAGVIDNNFLKFIDREIKRLDLKKNVIVFGQVSEKQKSEILSQSHLFLHLAKYEPLFPVIGILEGLSFGCSAIIYNMKVVSSQLNQLKKWKCLFIMKNMITKELAEKIIEYDQYSQEIKKLLFNEAKKFANLFDWDNIADKEFNVINNLMSSYGN